MEEKRIFIGSLLHTDMLEKLYQTLKKELHNKAKIKWTRTPDNFHITFRFIGKLPLNKIKEINKFLKEHFQSTQEIPLKIQGIKYFKRKGKPSVLYAEIKEEQGNQLQKIHDEIEEFLLNNGIITNAEKQFHPHITLGRIKSVSPEFYKEIEKYNTEDLGKINKFKIEIIESRLSPEGALYKPLKL